MKNQLLDLVSWPGFVALAVVIVIGIGVLAIVTVAIIFIIKAIRKKQNEIKSDFQQTNDENNENYK